MLIHSGLCGVVAVRVVIQATGLDLENESLARVNKAAIWLQKNLKIVTIYPVMVRIDYYLLFISSFFSNQK